MSSIIVAGQRNALALPIDTSEWSYLAEGGFHIILCYEGADPRLRRKILRIGKKSLGHENSEGRGVESDHPSAPHEGGTRRDFERGVLTPLLGSQYVQVGEAVELSRADMDNIHDSIDHLRPEGRTTRDSGHWSPAAQLEPNKTDFWLELPAGFKDVCEDRDDDEVIAVEVKPKGAVMPVSSLIPPGNNRLKHRVWRFDAQQSYKANKAQSWGAINRPCLYHPKEFYSGEARRAAATLKELIKTPQNKLRAWENGKMLFGAGSGEDDDHVLDLERAVKKAGLAGGDGEAPAEALMDLIGEILAKEPLVPRLLAAQALDVLEVEGGGLVFEKLVSLCEGSEDAALLMLEGQQSDPFEALSPDPDLVVPEETLAALREGSALPEGAESLDALYEKGVRAVERLSVQDCVQLLRRYIIGLGVMDCSVMMSLKAVKVDGDEDAAELATVQGPEVAGVVRTTDGRRVAYCVSVVDAGPKPPTKLRTKAKHEHKIWDSWASRGEIQKVA